MEASRTMRGEINGGREREDDGIGIQIRSRRESGASDDTDEREGSRGRERG